MTNKSKQKRKTETAPKNSELYTDTSLLKNDEINTEDNDVSLEDQQLYDRFDTMVNSKNDLLCNGSEMTTNKKLLKEKKSSKDDASTSKDQYPNTFFNQSDKPPSFHFEVDSAALLMFLIAICTRMWRLEEPKGIVFDELHYGKFASMYMKRTFFFDSHPPLGKQLIALAGYLAGYDGNSQFERIGGEYLATVPIRALRAIPAFFGSLLIPTVYYLIIELGFTHRTAVLAGILIIFENAYLTQSRFILMESMLIWFSAFGLLSYLKFRKIDRSFSLNWWLWFLLSSVSLTCAICVKYSGIFSAFLVITLVVSDYWKLIANTSLSTVQLLFHLLARFVAIFVVPLFIYLLIFYIHLKILTKAGPHDNIMTSGFQASLEGGLASITKGQPLDVAHGSQITLRHTHGRACWLHSHLAVYPLRYPDKRGSSHQQQVTCYSFKDVNNWWIVKRPDIPDLVVSDPIDKIKHGDVVQLIHGMSTRPLNSHDVAAPMSPQNQEVSCYIDYNISFPAQDLWKVDILNREAEGEVWHTIHSHVRFTHVNSGQALKFSGKQLPEWGFNQHEIVTDRVINQDDTIWNVEEHRYTKKADQKERERDMGMAEFVPLQPTQLSFIEKMWELQYKMFTTNSENVQDHIYSSDAADWPFLTRGIAYWVSPHSNAQIHLLGNITTWYSATTATVVYLVILVFYLLRRRRCLYDIPEDMWEKFCISGKVFLLGYILHFVPYFFVDRTLFLHHYLPAYFFKLLLLVTLVEHISFAVCLVKYSFLRKILHYSYLIVVCCWVLFVLYTFKSFVVFCYGTVPLLPEQILNLRWKDTWDFIIHVG
ncbi:protein O-mannosyl-transferase 1 [Parasteatoda tepidariorum]|uniref:protein O-mannosyl-transferase 1 n=1 Tax=Parasteatoda tepidariorum TaxID=114398 RepID=UPI001C727021|nr:protein O-mannosyl-transferase 1 [Parasteatoda tepidariorum]